MHASLPIATGLAVIVAVSSPAAQEWSAARAAAAELPRVTRPGL